MRDPADITPLQADILEILWSADVGTSEQVRAGLARSADLARTTVTTMLTRMEQYGWLERERKGRGFAYRPRLSRAELRGAQVRRIVRALFPRDLPSLVSHALREGDWEPHDLDRIEELVRALPEP